MKLLVTFIALLEFLTAIIIRIMEVQTKLNHLFETNSFCINKDEKILS